VRPSYRIRLLLGAHAKALAQIHQDRKHKDGHKNANLRWSRVPLETVEEIENETGSALAAPKAVEMEAAEAF